MTAETATYRKRWCREASEAGRWSHDDYNDGDGDDDGGAWVSRDFRGWSVVIDSGPVRGLTKGVVAKRSDVTSLNRVVGRVKGQNEGWKW